MEEKKMNKGEQYEKIVTEHFGLKWYKDNLRYDKGSDLENTKTSIKFGKASIMSTNENTKAREYGETKRIELINEFMASVASENFIYGYEFINGYKMDKEKFRQFLINFSILDNDSRTVKEKTENKPGKLKLRLKDIPVKERKWLETNATKINLQ